jgi:hypothetical protein
MAIFDKPSMSYWNRVEPSPRSDSLVRGLEAAVRDPAWFLARQWQMGEFRGEDAASPATISIAGSATLFESWTPRNGDPLDFDMHAPLEALVESEGVTPNWALAVELGQQLARALVRAGASTTTIDLFRAAYPTPRASDLTPSVRRDDALVRFLRVCGGRSIDGLAALNAAIVAAPAIPSAVGVPTGAEQTAAEAALASFISWARSVYGRIGATDAPAWRPERLDYDLETAARTPSGERVHLQAVAGQNGEFDWYAFDEITRDARGVESAPVVEQSSYSLFPTSVSFSGMPHSRWWQFEDSRFNWTNVDTDRRELAKTIILDFMLVQGNDWFIAPFKQKVGSLATLDQLLVRDVFGDWTLVQRADRGSVNELSRWTMYSTTISTAAGEDTANYFILPPSTLRTTMDGPDLEEIRFMRDEQANLVWAVEVSTENGVGQPWRGHERALTIPDNAPPPPATDAPLRYRLQTNVPLHWIPFPPVQIDATLRAVALERAAMQRFIDGALVRVEPVGRVLVPTNLEQVQTYRIHEEEATRSGIRVIRANKRSRWLDGSTHIWTARRRRAGLGEGASGLRYDQLDEIGTGVQNP